MFENDEDTCSLTLRHVRWQTIDALYEAKALTGLPICHLVDEIVWRWVKEQPSMLQTRLDHVHEDTGSLTLRSVRRRTVDALYEAKALTGKPICRLVDEIVTDWVEKHPMMLEVRQEEVRRLAEEFGA
jgi:hypothetical protein